MEESTELRALRRLAVGLGFSVAHTINGTTAYIHRSTKPCDCGGKVYIQPSIYEAGKWLAICQKCGVRTVLANNPIQAVKEWNADNYTYESKITKEGMKKDREVLENDLYYQATYRSEANRAAGNSGQ